MSVLAPATAARRMTIASISSRSVRVWVPPPRRARRSDRHTNRQPCPPSVPSSPRAQPRGLGKHHWRHIVLQETAGLVFPQPGVDSALTEQLLVRALLGDLAAVEHDQLVHARDRAQP